MCTKGIPDSWSIENDNLQSLFLSGEKVKGGAGFFSQQNKPEMDLLCKSVKGNF